MGMKGLSWSSLKKHYSLLPLFGFVGLGVIGAVGYSLRVLLKSPEVSLNRKNNPEPWNEYKNKQYKLYSSVDKEAHRSQAPEY